jgi:hypothetical protein
MHILEPEKLNFYTPDLDDQIIGNYLKTNF